MSVRNTPLGSKDMRVTQVKATTIRNSIDTNFLATLSVSLSPIIRYTRDLIAFKDKNDKPATVSAGRSVHRAASVDMAGFLSELERVQEQVANIGLRQSGSRPKI